MKVFGFGFVLFLFVFFFLFVCLFYVLFCSVVFVIVVVVGKSRKLVQIIVWIRKNQYTYIWNSVCAQKQFK